MYIYASNFQKRLNSTKQPGGYAARYDVLLKEKCSWKNPVFLLEESDFDYNYLQWGEWYYYVSDVTYIRNNLLEVSCTVDSLATFKGAILESRQFVAYANESNTEISDSRLSLKTSVTRSRTVSASAWDLITPEQSQMTAVINVVGETAAATYITTVNNAKNLLNSVKQWSEGIFSDIPASQSGLPELVEVSKRFFSRALSSSSAASCVKSACILPVKYSLLAGEPASIMLGGFDTGMQGRIPATRSLTDSNGVVIPWQASDWRRNAPYHSIYLYVPFIGVVTLPASELINAEGLYATIGIDITNGDATVKISTLSTGDHVVAVYNTNISIGYMIGASNVTPMQRITGGAALAGGAAAAVLSGGAVAGIAAGTGGILGQLNAVTPIPSSIGNPSGGATLGLGYDAYKLQCLTLFHDTIVPPDYNRSIIGEPYMRVAQLSDLSGYVECRNAHVALQHGFDSMAQEIDAFLNGGVYLE